MDRQNNFTNERAPVKSAPDYSDAEILEQVHRVKAYGFGDLCVTVQDGRVIQMDRGIKMRKVNR